MKRNTSLAAFGIMAILAFATFGQSFAQTTRSTTFKKGTPEAERELAAQAKVSVNASAIEIHGGHGERGAKRLEQMQQRLNLTAEQTAKIQTILQNSREKVKADREKAGTDREAFKSAMKESMKNTDAQINAVLTVEQMKKYAELKAEMKAKREERRENKDESRNEREQD